MNSGSETVRGLRPSPIAGMRSTNQETSHTQVPRGQISNTRLGTAPLTTSTLGITKHATVELSTSIYQASSITSKGGRNSFRELISTPESKGALSLLYYSTKPTSTSAPTIPFSSSIYQATSQESPARHTQGITIYILVMNIILNSLNTH